MPHVTKAQIAQAKRIDLLSYLKMYEPNNLVHISGPNYCIKENDSLKISNGKWNWFSRGIGGKMAFKYLMEVRQISFVDAVMTLCKEPVQVFEPIIHQKTKPFDSYYLSLGGVYASKDEKTAFKMPKALVLFLDNNSDISHITLCLDNDDTGHEASKFIAHRLVEKGYTVINKPPRNCKNYNEYLQKTNSCVKNSQSVY